MCLDRVPLLLLSSLTVIASANPQGAPAFLKNTFFGGGNRIAVPTIPASISQPALNAPVFSPYQASFARPQLPSGSSFRASLSGQTPSLGIQRQPLPSFTQFSSSVPVSPPRLGKAIESGRFSKPQLVPATFNQFSSGPGGVSPSRFQNSLDQAVDQAAKSAKFSLPEKSPSGQSQGLTNLGNSRQGSNFPKNPMQTFPERVETNSLIPSDHLNQFSSLPEGPSLTLNQLSTRPEASPQSVQTSLGQALDAASFSASQRTLPTQTRGTVNFGQPRQEPSSRFSQPSQIDLDQAPTRASKNADISSGLRTVTQLANIGPIIPAVPVSKPLVEEVSLGGQSPGSFRSPNIFRENTNSKSSPFIRKLPLGSPNQSGSPVFDSASSGNNFGRPSVFRSDPKTAEQRFRLSGSSSLPAEGTVKLNQLSPRIESSPQSLQTSLGQALDAASNSASFSRGNNFDRPSVFRSDPKTAEQRFQQSVPSSKSSPVIFSSLSSGSAIHRDTSPAKSCRKTFHEECHNEYTMVCEETFTERDKYQCNIVEETKCEKGFTTEYEPACFQQILEHCENMCKRGVQPDCTPQCARSLGKTSCHKVKVVTPHNTCTKVPKEVCGNVKKRVPYEKCHDVPRKVCEKIPREVCR